MGKRTQRVTDRGVQGEVRIWAKDLPGLTLPRDLGHVILAQASLLLSGSFCLICKMKTIIHTSQGQGLVGIKQEKMNVKKLHKL